MMRVLSVTSECVPLVKTGGLADVAGALPPALGALGIDMAVLLPGYPAVMKAIKRAKSVLAIDELFGGPARVLRCQHGGLSLLVLDAPHLFDRDGGIYGRAGGQDWTDNPERFAALSMVGAQIGARGLGDWVPDLLHAHDWQAGLAPYYLKRRFNAAVPSILTIHNIAFHGLAPASRLAALGIDPTDFQPDGVEFWGNISALKAGLMFADRLTTVSPTYADELTRAEFGMGLDGVIRQRRGDLSGILNGIDLDVWNPATDNQIAATYKTPRGKARNKAALRREFDLPDADGPLFVLVSRLTEQKGLDLLIEALPSLLAGGGQLALLGTGDPVLETALLEASDDANISVRIGYDEGLSHRMMAGGDAILIPSRFEPCGLTQLYGLRYGVVPVVSLTGGLADTVINASHAGLAAGAATGIQFHPVTADALSHALTRACALYRQPKVWTAMARRAMAHPVGWETSAAEYAALYQSVLPQG